MKQIAENTFWQLLAVYTVCVCIISLGFLSKYAFQFHIFAAIVALIGAYALSIDSSKDRDNRVIYSAHNRSFLNRELCKSQKYFLPLIIVCLAFVVILRIIPYLYNSVPLGYDAGIYRYGIIHGLQNLDAWIVSGGLEPGFLYLMSIVKSFIAADILLKAGFIFACVFLGFTLFIFIREEFNTAAATFSLIFYTFSIVQFYVFELMYYKHILALAIFCLSLFVLSRYEKYPKKISAFLFILLGAVLAAIHRPTFYIFGLSFAAYAFINPLLTRRPSRILKNVLIGVCILVLAAPWYLTTFSPAILSMISPVLNSLANPGESPGTFISAFQYQFAVLTYLPLALLGFFVMLKMKRPSMLAFATIICGFIVYAQLFFFNRFLIHLDILLISCAGLGSSVLLKKKRDFAIFILILLIASSALIVFKESTNTKPLTDPDSLDFIKNISSVLPNNSSLMVTSSRDAPWVLGYSGLPGNKIIAPGMFDANSWSLQEWQTFWSNPDENITRQMFSVYEKPLYIYSSTDKFKNACLSPILDKKGNMLYEYTCDDNAG